MGGVEATKGMPTGVIKGSLTSVGKKWSFLARQAKSTQAMRVVKGMP
jgi:hypothetical protein